MLSLMGRKHFGFDSFFIVSHDRGSRVAHRLALDNPEKVRKLMVLDITPTVHMYEHTDMMFVSEPGFGQARLIPRHLGTGIGSFSSSRRRFL